MRSLVTSIFLCACELWTLTAELQRRIQAMEIRFFRKIPHISYKDHAKIQQAIGPHEDLLTIVKRRKRQWYGHVSRSSGLAKTILQGTMKVGRRQGRQRERWEDNIREWRPGVRQVPKGSGEQGKMKKTVCRIICGASTTLAVKGLMMMMMKHLISMVCILLWSSAVRVHNSQAYRKMDVTRERMAQLLKDKCFCFCLAVDGRLPDRQPRQRRPLLPDDGVHRPAQRSRH